MKYLRVYACLLFTMLGVSGCDLAPRRMLVTGSVTVNGKPAEGAILMFHPSDPKEATASAIVESDGNFKIISGGEPGVIQGKYQITVIWPDPSKKPTKSQSMMGTADVGPDLLKGKYSSKNASTLSAEIRSDSTKLPPFEL